MRWGENIPIRAGASAILRIRSVGTQSGGRFYTEIEITLGRAEGVTLIAALVVAVVSVSAAVIITVATGRLAQVGIRTAEPMELVLVLGPVTGPPTVVSRRISIVGISTIKPWRWGTRRKGAQRGRRR